MATNTTNAFKPRECLKVIQNLFAPPKYTTLKMGMKAYIKLMCYCHLAGDQEITGLGRIKNGEIVDFKIPHQEVGGATAYATDDAIISLMREIPIDEIKEWELDWHSHVNMATSPSQTDWDNYELMSMARGGNQFPFMIANKKGEITLKNYIHEDKHPNITLDIGQQKLTNEEIEIIYNECKSEVALKLQMKPIPATYATSYNSYKQPVSYRQEKLSNFSYDYDYDTYGYDYSYRGKSAKKNDLDSFGNDTAEADNYGRCQSCGVQLVTAEEFENGLCDDCLEAWYSCKR